MSSKRGDLFHALFNAFKKRYPEKKSEECQKVVVSIWKETKEKKLPDNEFEETITSLITSYQQYATRRKASNILNYFQPKRQTLKPDESLSISINEEENSHREQNLVVVCSDSKTQVKRQEEKIEDTPCGSQTPHLKIENIKRTNTDLSVHEKVIDDDNHVVIPALKRQYDKPAQNSIALKIEVLQKQLLALIEARDTGLKSQSIDEEISQLRKKLETERKNLKIAQDRAVRQKKYRDKTKSVLNRLSEKYPDIPIELKRRTEEGGRPRLEEQQDGLLKTIADIAMFGAATHDRRRDESLRSCKTLSQLHEQITAMGFQLSRSATYLRLLPRNSNTREGRRHITTVPVKLCRADSDLHKSHKDQSFCIASIRSLETLASILGPEQVAFLSQDDKARIPIGITAVKKQSPFLMHLEYRVSLPDHDWVIAQGHKLIPSVYAGIKIKSGCIGSPDAVSYSGPTYVAIRSGKHSSSTANTHAVDFENLLNLDIFAEIVKNSHGNLKPIFMISVDGGPDENPRYTKVIAHAVQHFRKFDLDALYIFTNAPGRSAFNRVERRMAPLSRALSGLVIPYDQFGSHLDDKGKTVDEELEIRNFEFAGTVLTEVWNELMIDGHPVYAEYITPSEEKSTPGLPQSSWYAKHVQESQYLLQIIKCTDTECCKPLRSGLRQVLPNGFIVPPYPVKQGVSSMEIPESGSEDYFAPFLLRQSLSVGHLGGEFLYMPYDYYCPSIQTDLKDRTCLHCGKYFASKKSVQTHVKQLHPKHSLTQGQNRVKPVTIIARRNKELLCTFEEQNFGGQAEWMDEEDVDITGLSIPCDANFSGPVIKSIVDWLSPTWTDDTNI